MKLVRSQNRADGIFSRLFNDHGVPQCYTLEHSYANLDGTFSPKIPNGQFICVRGMHQLASMSSPFETFEITGVPNCTGILIHWGNWDRDSSGCILVGNAVVTQDDGTEMIVNSKNTFEDFMNSMDGITEFMLTVS